MQLRSGLKPITLSLRNKLFVGIVVLLVVPIVLGFPFFDSLYAVYLSRFVAPGLESALGSKVAMRLFDGEMSRIRHTFLLV